MVAALVGQVAQLLAHPMTRAAWRLDFDLTGVVVAAAAAAVLRRLELAGTVVLTQQRRYQTTAALAA